MSKHFRQDLGTVTPGGEAGNVVVLAQTQPQFLSLPPSAVAVAVPTETLVLAKNRIKVESRFPAVKRAAWETVQSARALALDAGEEVANRKVEKVNDERGYNLPKDTIGQEKIGFQSGKVFIGGKDEFWWRFFEYGTVHIPASPMIRPASSAMRSLPRSDGRGAPGRYPAQGVRQEMRWPLHMSTEKDAWERYLATLRHDVAPPYAGYEGNYDTVESFAWARLQEELEELDDQ